MSAGIWLLVCSITLWEGVFGVTQPLIIHCNQETNNTIVLSVVQTRVNIDNVLQFNSRVYAYKGVPYVPGPTISMKAGEDCKIQLVNQLSTDTTQSNCYDHHNGFHCPDTTNLHTHGLHVSPADDDINTTITPGNSHTYTYHISKEHLMGTHWYHAHWHGSTAIQVLGGMAGALVIEPHDSYDLGSWRKFYDNSVFLVLNHWIFSGNDPGAGRAFDFYDYPGLSAVYSEETVPPQPVFNGPTEFYSVNGFYQPTHSIQAGKIQVFRLVHAVGLNWIEISLNRSDCSMTLLARDGVFQFAPYLQLSTYVFLPGTRSDIAIQCPVNAGGSTVVVSARQTTENQALGGIQFTQDVLMYLNITRSADGAYERFPSQSFNFPEYLGSLMNEETSPHETDLIFFNALTMTVNDLKFPGFESDGPWIDHLCLNHVYDFTIATLGAGSSHPYHQHINHFQIYNSHLPSSITRLGEWRDNCPDLDTTIRMKTWDFTGAYVFHCHIFEHEDQGMMNVYQVTDCPATTGTSATSGTTRGRTTGTTATTGTTRTTGSTGSTGTTGTTATSGTTRTTGTTRSTGTTGTTATSGTTGTTSFPAPSITLTTQPCQVGKIQFTWTGSLPSSWIGLYQQGFTSKNHYIDWVWTENRSSGEFRLPNAPTDCNYVLVLFSDSSTKSPIAESSVFNLCC